MRIVWSHFWDYNLFKLKSLSSSQNQNTPNQNTNNWNTVVTLVLFSQWTCLAVIRWEMWICCCLRWNQFLNTCYRNWYLTVLTVTAVCKWMRFHSVWPLGWAKHFMQHVAEEMMICSMQRKNWDKFTEYLYCIVLGFKGNLRHFQALFCL